MIRVLIVDDSATARTVLKEILESDKDINVVGVAPDAYIARDKVVALKPDVVCLDVEMPRMDGITFLRKLMQYFPTPVVMISSLTKKGAKVTIDALEAGAIDFVTKPHANIYDGIDLIRDEIIQKVKSASKINPKKIIVTERKVITNKPVFNSALAETTKKVIAMGSSTGGTEALKDVLMKFPRNSPGIVIVQHMPGNFTKAFAQRLNSLCQIDVKEAENGDFVSIGQALIAPGDYHMVLRRSGARYFVEIGDGDKVSGHKPSVDVLFNSVAKTAGANALGVIMTGMGADGAKGMLNMHKAGAKTIAQDEASCVVFGMPKVAIELGGVDIITSLNNIPKEVMNLIQNMS